MATDVDAIFGIGYKVKATKELLKKNEDFCRGGYLDSKITKGFEYGLVGDIYDDSVEDKWYVFINSKYEKDIELDFDVIVKKKTELRKILSNLKLKIVSQFGVHGGLLIS